MVPIAGVRVSAESNFAGSTAARDCSGDDGSFAAGQGEQQRVGFVGRVNPASAQISFAFQFQLAFGSWPAAPGGKL